MAKDLVDLGCCSFDPFKVKLTSPKPIYIAILSNLKSKRFIPKLAYICKNMPIFAKVREA
jgi:hypothetical protein